MLTPDLASTQAFLSLLPKPPDGRETICVLTPNGDFVPKTLFHHEAPDYLLPHQGISNCYWQVNTGVPDKKLTKNQVLFLRMLHVDLDKDPPNDLAALKAFNPEPTCIIFSGGGYQGFWIFKEVLGATPERVAQMEDLNHRIAAMLGGDHCWNIDRVMRLPGTYNVPNEAKRKRGRETTLATVVNFYQDLLYTPDDFAHLPPVPASSSHSGQQSADSTQIRQLRLDDLQPDKLSRISPEVQDLILRGNADKKYQSRSEAVHRVCCRLATVSMPRDIIAGLLVHPDNDISISIRERSNPYAEAQRQAERGYEVISNSWKDTVGKTGAPMRYSYPNCLQALMRLGYEGHRDIFAERMYIWNTDLELPKTELNEATAGQIRQRIIDTYDFDPGKDNTFEGLSLTCNSNEVHPRREYYKSLEGKWDGERRLHKLFSYYFGAEDTPFNRDISEIILTASVRRVKHPGTKFDTIPVLEGPQGSNKSTALAILATKAFFSDQDILAMDPKSQVETMTGKVIIEVSEMAGIRRTELHMIKSFLSRDTDRLRPAYGRVRLDKPRQTIFIGTTNEDKYLRDTTGNRRFWPIKTTQVLCDELRADADQLWAEAVYLESIGRPITLDEKLWGIAAEIQRSRLQTDSWAEELQSIGAYLQNDMLRVSSQDVLGHLGRPAEKQGPGDFDRARDAMRANGWTGPKAMRINGSKPVRGYEAPNDGSVPCVVIPEDPSGAPRPPHLRVVDENFKVNGETPSEPKKQD